MSHTFDGGLPSGTQKLVGFEPLREPSMQMHAPSAPIILPESGRADTADLEDFFENGSLSLHLVGPDGTILRANKAELELLGYDSTEYVGRNIADFHADKDVIEDILKRLKRGEKLVKYPARLVAKDVSIKHVEITSSVQFLHGKFKKTRCF